MDSQGLVLAPCQHQNSTQKSAQGCPACYGSGFVRVIPAPDGKPMSCQHGNSMSHNAMGCPSCYGSGWAGLVTGKD